MGATRPIPRPYSAPDLYRRSLSPYQNAYSVYIVVWFISKFLKPHCSSRRVASMLVYTHSITSLSRNALLDAFHS